MGALGDAPGPLARLPNKYVLCSLKAPDGCARNGLQDSLCQLLGRGTLGRTKVPVPFYFFSFLAQ